MSNKNIPNALVKRLEMKHFRCFTKKIVCFEESITIIDGCNGIGKTSILEALYYGCYLRSFRTASPKELVAFEFESFFIKIDIVSYNDSVPFEQHIQIGFEAGKRRVKVDGKPISSYKELMSCLRIVSLTEDDMHLIKGAPQERRTFLDYAIVLENHDYAHNLNVLRNIILTRNTMLKPTNSFNPIHYKVITEQLWEQSRIVQAERVRYSTLLQQEINRLIQEYFKEEFSLECDYSYKKTMGDTFEQFLENHPSLTEMERRLQRSCFGAHLDDLSISFNTTGSRHFASRGQQKLILLLIKIAQIVLLQRQGHHSALVFLLDDYMTDFDDYRGGVLLKMLQNLNIQLIFTAPTTSGPLFNQNVESRGVTSRVSL